jgi:galactokinase
MHIVQELSRVNDAGEALKKGDLPALTRLFFHSHESLRDLYEVSCPEIDWLVKRAQEIDGVLGSRMTGQGFGGCTYTLISENAVEEYRRRLDDYERIFGFHPLTYEVRIAGGARVVPAAKSSASGVSIQDVQNVLTQNVQGTQSGQTAESEQSGESFQQNGR